MIFAAARRYLAVLGIAALASSFLFGGLQYRRANGLEADLATEKIASASRLAAIEGLTAARDADLAELAGLSQALTESRGRMSLVIEELEELKRNESMVQADPARAQQLVNDRIERVFIDLACATGADREDCTNPAAEAEPAQ